jgi:hypothetical protein
MFLKKLLVVFEAANGESGRRCRNNKLERAIDGIIRGRGGKGGEVGVRIK